jgi:hypothetical protein
LGFVIEGSVLRFGVWGDLPADDAGVVEEHIHQPVLLVSGVGLKVEG